MHLLPPQRSRHDLHRSAGIIAPAGDVDLGQARVTGRKQRRMPGEQAFPRYRRMAIRRRIQHHLDDALDVAIDRRQRTNVYAQTAGDAGTYGGNVQLLALDLAGLDDILREHHKTCPIAQHSANVGQPPNQHTLRPAHLGHRPGQGGQVAAPLRPVRSMPDVFVIAVIHAAIMSGFLRTRKRFTAR